MSFSAQLTHRKPISMRTSSIRATTISDFAGHARGWLQRIRGASAWSASWSARRCFHAELKVSGRAVVARIQPLSCERRAAGPRRSEPDNDQRIVAGIEILRLQFCSAQACGPTRRAGRVTRDEIEKIAAAVPVILRAANRQQARFRSTAIRATAGQFATPSGVRPRGKTVLHMLDAD